MKIRKLIGFVSFLFVVLLNFNSFTIKKVYVIAETSENQSTMKSEDWKIVTEQNKDDQKNDFKSIQKNEATKDESLNDISIYYVGGLIFLVVGVIGIFCSICSLFRIRKMREL